MKKRSAICALVAMILSCTPAMKTDIRTAVDEVSKTCQSGVPQSIAILIDPTTGAPMQIACVAEEDLASAIDRLIALKRAQIRAKLGIPTEAPKPPASAGSTTP